MTGRQRVKHSEDSMLPIVSGGLYGVGPLLGRDRLPEAAGRGARRDMGVVNLSCEPRQAGRKQKTKREGGNGNTSK